MSGASDYILLNPPKFSKYIMQAQHTREYTTQNAQTAYFVWSKTWAGIVEYLPTKFFLFQRKTLGARPQRLSKLILAMAGGGLRAFKFLTGTVHSLGLLFRTSQKPSMSLAKLQVFASHISFTN